MKGSWLRAGIGGPAHLAMTSGGDYLTTACKVLLRKGTTLDVRTQVARLDGKDVTLPLAQDVCQECKRVAIGRG